MRLTRRSILRTGSVAAIFPLFGQAPLPATPARAQNSEPQWRHGLSLFGDLKYPPGFRHFDYVNPQAPASGILTTSIRRRRKVDRYASRRSALSTTSTRQ